MWTRQEEWTTGQTLDHLFLNIHKPFTNKGLSCTITYIDKQCYMPLDKNVYFVIQINLSESMEIEAFVSCQFENICWALTVTIYLSA